MDKGKDIKVHVTGGDNWKDRELVTDTIATAMRDRGFNAVTALNSVGRESNHIGVTPRTVFEAVKIVSPNLINRSITVDPGYDEQHPEASGQREGQWRELPGTEMSVYDPTPKPTFSRWDREHRIPGIHTAIRTEGTQYGAILDVRNSDRPGLLIEAVEREFNEEVVHVGIIAETLGAATDAVKQALLAQPNAHVTVSLTEGVLPGLVDTKNSQFFRDQPREITAQRLPSVLSAVESEMRRYGNPETFSVKPQDDGLVSISMEPRTKGEADKMYSAIMSGPSGQYNGLVGDSDFEEGYLTKDDFGNPLNDDPNHARIVELIESNMRRAKPIDNNLIVEHVAKEAADNALKRADEHLANARASLEKAKAKAASEIVVYNPPIDDDKTAEAVAAMDADKQSRKRNKK